MTGHTPEAKRHGILRIVAVFAMAFGMFAPLGQAPAAYAASIASASFSSTAPGTIVVGGTLFARSGRPLTLTVLTSSDTRCVSLGGTLAGLGGPPIQTSSAPKTNWTFPFFAPGGDSAQSVSITVGEGLNNPGTACTTRTANGGASFVNDNTGPVVVGTRSLAPNGAGWNRSPVSIAWSAVDNGAGFSGSNPYVFDFQTTDTAGTTFTRSTNDRLGNIGSGSVTVKLDMLGPGLAIFRNVGPNPAGWNNTDVTVMPSCSDALSGIKSCTPATTLTAETAGAMIPVAAVDNADNQASTVVGPIKIDKTAPNPPTINASPAANGAGWNNSSVSFVATPNGDVGAVQSGAVPVCSTIAYLTGETSPAGTTVSATCNDLAGNTSAASSKLIKIDLTAPNTTAAAPANWNNSDVAVALNASDALSQVAATYYKLDNGSQQTYNAGNNIAISDDGSHTLEFWSVDNAGNEESHKTIEVKIDKTPPTINHAQSPGANGNGWNNSDVTVTFTCADGASGIASCTGWSGSVNDGVTVTAEGKNQAVTGTATDNAGNSATDPATVSIDKTAPTISAAADRAANANGWYDNDVTVSFTCADQAELSGVAGCSPAVTKGEGANQSADGTAADAADNSASASLSGINIDKTAPSLSGAPTSAPNGNGWYSGDVTVRWTASDALSGLEGDPPADSTVSGEGAALSASASVIDLAGNGTNATVGDIKIDRTAPSTLAAVPAPLASGWYAGEVLVTLTTGADLSGIEKTYYSVDGGPAQEYAAPFNHGLKGSHTITFWSVDNAGNTEDKSAPGHSITLQIDGLPPTITGDRSPAANGFGWNNAPVTASFACSDAESGIAACSDPVTLTSAGEGQAVVGQAQDNAGNTSDATVSGINIDLTAPTLAGAPTTPDNAAGWYNGNVAIAWAGSDALSGIDPATQPSDSTISGEGRGLSAGPVTISDKAGNISPATYSSAVNIDRSPPTINGATTTQPNAAGWYNGAVTVAFACADPSLADGTAGSGVANCSDAKVLSGDGANQSVTSDVPNDNAGNSGAARTVGGIKIDGQPPQTAAAESCTGKNGYCRGQKATVVLTAADQAGLSGVKEIRYSVNGGPEKTASGASISVDVPLAAQSGLATVEFWAVDLAGNAEPKGGVSLKFDNLAPMVTHTRSPLPNANDWNNTDVALDFSATDDPGGSGVDDASWVNQHVVVSNETAGQTVSASVEDMAGNLGNDAAVVKIDKTRPTISGAATTQPNASGWYKSAVTIKWTCADMGAVQSGVASCPADDVIISEGAGQSRSGTVSDRAGNSESKAVEGIKIDTTEPAIIISGLQAFYTLGAPVSLSCTASDALSGLEGACAISVTGGNASGVGSFSYTATAKDKAGNVATKTGTYSVRYGWSGFAQPINDTAHQVDQNVSIFKGGSTVPVKFQLKNAAGQAVQAAGLPQWMTPQIGGPTTAAVDEDAYTLAATSGGTYRWDGTAQQYIFNWSTKGSTSGRFYRIGVKLDDGMTYYVNIGLR
jgi:hypothetical protein